jgi:hypothetical protein
MAAAAGAGTIVGPGAVAVCFDALRGDVYGAVYDVQPGQVATLLAPMLLTVADLRQRSPVTPRAAIGDGAVNAGEQIVAWTGRAPLALDQLPLGAESLLRLLEQPDVGRVIDQASEPVYGRPAEAQARWEARHGRALPGPTGRGS